MDNFHQWRHACNHPFSKAKFSHQIIVYWVFHNVQMILIYRINISYLNYLLFKKLKIFWNIKLGILIWSNSISLSVVDLQEMKYGLEAVTGWPRTAQQLTSWLQKGGGSHVWRIPHIHFFLVLGRIVLLQCLWSVWYTTILKQALFKKANALLRFFSWSP